MTTVDVLLPDIARIGDPGLRDRIVATWEDAWQLSELGSLIHEIPFTMQAPDEPLLRHIGRVVEVATLLESYASNDGLPRLDHDILIASCLLHDVDKVCMIQPNSDAAWEPTRLSRRYPHGILGAMLCRDHGVDEAVVHIVATHATNSTLPPEPFEGVVLHYADLFAADAALFAAGSPLLMAPKASR